MSAFLLARFLPPLLIGPFAGVLVDRFDRKRLLIFSDISRAIVVILLLIFAAGLTGSTLWLIYLLTVIQFIHLLRYSTPARNAIMPTVCCRATNWCAPTPSAV